MQVEVCVYYGGKAISKRVFSPHAKVSRDFFDCVVWDKWLVNNYLQSMTVFEYLKMTIINAVEI